MQVQYDTEADALYVRLEAGEVARTRRLDSSRAVDYRADGAVVGVEFLSVSKGVRLEGVPEVERIGAALASIHSLSTA